MAYSFCCRALLSCKFQAMGLTAKSALVKSVVRFLSLMNCPRQLMSSRALRPRPITSIVQLCNHYLSYFLTLVPASIGHWRQFFPVGFAR